MQTKPKGKEPPKNWVVTAFRLTRELAYFVRWVDEGSTGKAEWSKDLGKARRFTNGEAVIEAKILEPYWQTRKVGATRITAEVGR